MQPYENMSEYNEVGCCLSINHAKRPLSWADKPAGGGCCRLYNHAQLPLFDKLARKRMAELGVPLLDLSPLYLRADHHVHNYPNDTLHFRAPGPHSIAAPLLSGALKERCLEHDAKLLDCR